MLTKEQILGASDVELDLLCAKHIMEWDVWTEEDEQRGFHGGEIEATSEYVYKVWDAQTVWVTLNPKDELADMSMSKRYYWMGNEFVDSWIGYIPTLDNGQACDLLDKLAKQGLWSYVFTKTQPYIYYKVQIGKHHEEGYCEDKSRPKAIVIAALLAVVAMEEV